MLTIPAEGWRGGLLLRGLVNGVCGGAFLAVLAFIDGGLWFAAAIVFVIIGIGYGTLTTRRMRTFWPAALDFSADDRVAIVRAARRGERVGDARLAQGVIDYSAGMHEADAQTRHFRWVVPVVLGVAVALAVWDTFYGSTRDAVASCIYLVLMGIEVFWWPPRLRAILANTERATEFARELISEPDSEAAAG